MPEGLEAEIWRTAIADTVGRRVANCWVDERVAPPGFVDLVTGTRIIAVRRAGKVVVIETDGPSIGLHFGMTGRIVVDGRSPIAQLEYASGRDESEWDRLLIWTNRRAGRIPAIRMNDPRRFGRVSLDPDLSHLGIDVFAVTAAGLRQSFGRRRTSVKAVLLDQSVVAGLGNLCVDEVLWWAGVDPRRQADGLASADIAAIVTAIRRRLPIMLRRGGSTTGTINPQLRRSLGPCPKDGGELVRGVVATRTTVWCARHQC